MEYQNKSRVKEKNQLLEIEYKNFMKACCTKFSRTVD